MIVGDTHLSAILLPRFDAFECMDLCESDPCPPPKKDLHTQRRMQSWQMNQWSSLVPLIGGRYHVIPQLAVYTTYIALIYFLLGDFISPTTYSGNQKQLLHEGLGWDSQS